MTQNRWVVRRLMANFVKLTVTLANHRNYRESGGTVRNYQNGIS